MALAFKSEAGSHGALVDHGLPDTHTLLGAVSLRGTGLRGRQGAESEPVMGPVLPPSAPQSLTMGGLAACNYLLQLLKCLPRSRVNKAT